MRAPKVTRHVYGLIGKQKTAIRIEGFEDFAGWQCIDLSPAQARALVVKINKLLAKAEDN